MNRTTGRYRVGVDVGGTFTDLICVTPSGEVVIDKTPSTLDDQSTGVMNGFTQLADRFGLSVEIIFIIRSAKDWIMQLHFMPKHFSSKTEKKR